MRSRSITSKSRKDLSAAELARLERAWADNEAQYPTEEACVEVLWRRAREEDLVRCRYCGSGNLYKETGARVCICLSCNGKRWFTSRTLFHGARSAKPWLGAILLMEQGFVLTSPTLARLASIAQSTALNILRKIRAVVQNNMDEHAPAAESSCFENVICKRSRETPAREHPKAEELNFAEAPENYTDTSLTKYEVVPPAADIESSITVSASEPSKENETTPEEAVLLEAPDPLAALKMQQKKVYAALSETPIGIDALCQLSGLTANEVLAALTMLQIEGLLQCFPGDRFARAQQKPLPVVVEQTASNAESANTTNDTIIKLVIKFIRLKHHGISRKYLQNYIAGYWCRIARRFWHGGILLKACLHSKPIFYQDLLDYVSQNPVRILPGAIGFVENVRLARMPDY